MATAQSTVQSVVTFANKRIFSVSGSGIWAEDTTHRVATGTWYSGWMEFGLPDPKIAIKMSVGIRSGEGSFTAALATGGDSSTYTAMGGSTATTEAGGNAILPANQTTANEFEVKLTMARSALDATDAPVISRLTLMANPAPPRRVKITAPLMLHQELMLRNRRASRLDPSFERAQIESLLQSNQIVTFQETGASYAVTVDDFHWVPYEQNQPNHRRWDGTMVVELKVQT